MLTHCQRIMRPRTVRTRQTDGQTDGRVAATKLGCSGINPQLFLLRGGIWSRICDIRRRLPQQTRNDVTQSGFGRPFPGGNQCRDVNSISAKETGRQRWAGVSVADSSCWRFDDDDDDDDERMNFNVA